MQVIVYAIIFLPLILAACGLLITSRMRQLRWLVHLAVMPAIWVVGLLGGFYLSSGFGMGFLIVTLPIVSAGFGLYVCGAVLIWIHYRDASQRPNRMQNS